MKNKKVTQSLDCVQACCNLFILTNPENQIINQEK